MLFKKETNFSSKSAFWTQALKKSKRLFLQSLHSVLDKNYVNERAPLLRIYASLVSSLWGNEH